MRGNHILQLNSSHLITVSAARSKTNCMLISWVYLQQLHVMCNWEAASSRIRGDMTTKMGEHRTCQDISEICFQHGLEICRNTQSLEVWPKVQNKSNYWSDYCWGTSSWVRSGYIRGDAFPLSLLCNYIMTSLYWVGAAFTGCLTVLTHRGQKTWHKSTKYNKVS